MPKQRPPIIDETVHESLRRAVHASPLSVTWLARQLGRDRTTIYKWLEGTNAIPPQMLDRLCTLLELTSEQRMAQFIGRGYAIPRSDLNSVHHLRAPVGDFSGRAGEIDRIVASLGAVAQNAALATISGVRGMGGIGKTELALMAAQQLRAHFPHGQVLVELHGAGSSPISPVQALQTILRAFDPSAKLPEELSELQGRYHSYLHGKRILILADDAHDAAQVQPLMPPPGSALLVTSRQRFVLPAMLRIDLGVLLPDEAEQLLRVICPRIGDAAPKLALLCGYLPLALRISASFLESNDSYPLVRYLSQLESARLKYLRDPEHPDDPHASVEASIALSYDALAPAIQLALCCLSVFPRSFDLAAALAVLAAIGGDAEALIHQLRRHSLLEWDSQRERYHLHDLVREFAAARLADSSDARQRHALYFLALAERVDSAAEGTWQTPWLDRMEREHTNLVAALDWWMQSKQEAYALRFATALGAFWIGRDHLREGSAQLRAVLARTASGHERLRAQALAHLGAIGRVQGQLDVARRAYEESCALFQWLEDEEQYADAIFKLGLLVSDQGEKLAARAYFEESLTYFRQQNLPNRIASVLSNLGRTALDTGDYSAAQRYYTESYTLMRTTADTEELAWLLVNLARLASVLGDYASALNHVDASLHAFHALGHSQGTAWALLRKGNVLEAQAQLAAARACFLQTMALFEQLENQVGIAMTHRSLARVALAQADERSAWQHALACIDHFRSLQNRLGIGMGIELVARLMLARDAALATRLLGVASTLHESTGVIADPVDRSTYTIAVAEAREQLNPLAFAQAWAAGQAIELEQAVAEIFVLNAQAVASHPDA